MVFTGMAWICDLDADVRAYGSNQLNEELNASTESQSPPDSLCVCTGAAGEGYIAPVLYRD